MKSNRTFKEALHIFGIHGIIMMINLAGRFIGPGSVLHRIIKYAFS